MGHLPDIPACPKSTRKRKSTIVSDSEPEEVEDSEPVATNKTKAEIVKTDVIWDAALTWKLVSAIEEPEIKPGLFPSAGEDMLRSTSKNKQEYYGLLAKTLFADHELYGAAYTAAMAPGTTAAQRKHWSSKIKNRIDKLVSDTHAHTTEMGQTGEGIERADEIDMSQNNQFTMKWAEIESHSPWYWNMKALVGQRPNITPVGLGNNEADIDLTVLDMKSSSHATSPIASSQPPDDDKEEIDELAGDVSGPEDPAIEETRQEWKRRKAERRAKEKEKAKVKEEMKKDDSGKKSGRGNNSADRPVKASGLLKKAQKASQRFADVSLKEEETLQMTLGVRKTKVETEAHNDLEKYRIKAELQRKKEKRQAEYAQMKLKADQEKLKMEHELGMMRMQMMMMPPTHSYGGQMRHGGYGGPGMMMPPSFGPSTLTSNSAFVNGTGMSNSSHDGVAPSQPASDSFDATSFDTTSFGMTSFLDGFNNNSYSDNNHPGSSGSG
ncbi:hypothetical protein C8J56DRAFT_1054044 [Mycena floridula]|nr:hypothetical protein C8J56DRAFT_1054044 [Mycena floridula]